MYKVSSNGDYSGVLEYSLKVLEGKIYSRTDIISDRRLQRYKHGSDCAKPSEQQDMLALG